MATFSQRRKAHISLETNKKIIAPNGWVFLRCFPPANFWRRVSSGSCFWKVLTFCVTFVKIDQPVVNNNKKKESLPICYHETCSVTSPQHNDCWKEAFLNFCGFLLFPSHSMLQVQNQRHRTNISPMKTPVRFMAQKPGKELHGALGEVWGCASPQEVCREGGRWCMAR